MAFRIFLIFLFTSVPVVAAAPKTIIELPVPRGYSRIDYPAGSYGNWITRLPVKEGKSVATYSGGFVADDYYNVMAIVDMPLLYKQDLEQCADWAFRFRAEFFRQTNRLDKLYLFDYNGNKKYFSKSGKSFSQFLKWTMSYANSYSIKKGCAEVPEADLKPGDMVVQNEKGGIGHVSVIVSVCESPEKNRLYLIGFSFMPAQEFHIEYAGVGFGKEGWYSLDGYYQFLREYLDLGALVLKRFEEK